MAANAPLRVTASAPTAAPKRMAQVRAAGSWQNVAKARPSPPRSPMPNSNPPEAVVPRLEADRYYRWLTWATVPLHFVALIGCAWWAGTQDLSWWALVLLAYVAGTDAGLRQIVDHQNRHDRAELADAKRGGGLFGGGHRRAPVLCPDHGRDRWGPPGGVFIPR